MSLESLLKRNNVKNFFGRQHYLKFDKSIGPSKQYEEYLRKKDFKRAIVDSSGKILFGGLYNKWDGFETSEGKIFLSGEREGTYGSQYFREDGSIAFGGIHCRKENFEKVNGIGYLLAQHEEDGPWGFYREDGLFFNTFVEAGLSQIEVELSSSGLRDSFCKSFAKVYSAIIYDSHLFLEGAIGYVKDIYKQNNAIMFKKALQQFISGLEYFASHPDEALGFVSGGLRQ